MSNSVNLYERADHKCELCATSESLTEFSVSESAKVLICETCHQQINDGASLDPNHFRCLSNSMWSEYKEVQALSWKILNFLKTHSWANGLLEQLYLDESTQSLTESMNILTTERSEQVKTKDSNGAALNDGDSVTLIKDLVVKGAGFTAKRGTLVKNIRLTNNPQHIEGKVNGSQIVLVANFLKKVT